MFLGAVIVEHRSLPPTFSYNAFLPQSEIDALVLMIAPSLPKILPETPHGTMQGQTPSPLQKSCQEVLLEAGSGTIVTRTRDPAGTSASDSWRLDLDWAGLEGWDGWAGWAGWMDGLGGRLSPQMWDCMQGGGHREPHFFTLAEASSKSTVQWLKSLSLALLP